MGGYIFLLILSFILMIGGYAWYAYTQHCKNQNARDLHRMIKNGELPTYNDSQAGNSSVSDLERLSKLYLQGTITKEEYEAAKKKLLGI